MSGQWSSVSTPLLSRGSCHLRSVASRSCLLFTATVVASRLCSSIVRRSSVKRCAEGIPPRTWAVISDEWRQTLFYSTSPPELSSSSLSFFGAVLFRAVLAAVNAQTGKVYSSLLCSTDISDKQSPSPCWRPCTATGSWASTSLQEQTPTAWPLRRNQPDTSTKLKSSVQLDS